MSIAVNLWSRKLGDIKKFLESFYEKDNVYLDEDTDRWIYVYRNPLEAVDIISAVMDNNDKYDISLCIEMENGDLHPVTYENHNDIIKGIFVLFYKEGPELTY